MGDGPAYDHMYEETARLHKEKRRKQITRMGYLQSMRTSVGFGDTDPDRSLLEKQIVFHLEMAEELLEIITRQDRKEFVNEHTEKLRRPNQDGAEHRQSMGPNQGLGEEN